MHRPTRQHSKLLEKIEAKVARSRVSGKKAKRWKKWAEQYKTLSQTHVAEEEPKKKKKKK